jgi:hypothetical protein
MRELLVGWPELNVFSIDDVAGDPRRVHIEGRSKRPGCAGCGAFAQVKDRPVVELVDLPGFGRPTRLIWHQHWWRCPESSCATTSWIGKELPESRQTPLISEEPDWPARSRSWRDQSGGSDGDRDRGGAADRFVGE